MTNISLSTLVPGVFPAISPQIFKMEKDPELGEAAYDLLYPDKALGSPSDTLKKFRSELAMTVENFKVALFENSLSSEETASFLWDIESLPDHLEIAKLFIEYAPLVGQPLGDILTLEKRDITTLDVHNRDGSCANQRSGVELLATR